MDVMSSHTFYEKYNIQSFTTLDRIRKKNIIDAWAYISDTVLIFQDFTIRNVYAFEATKTNYTLMLKTLELNKTSKVIPINKGLGLRIKNYKLVLMVVHQVCWHNISIMISLNGQKLLP